MKRLKSKNLLISLALLLCTTIFAQDAAFNADSAYAYNEHLAVTIGPRKMGSANERASLKWAMEKFRSFGADTAYILPFYKTGRGVNTTSGTAIGIFSGKKDSMIVVGGHIDSTPAENPGASDNASGTACVVELARNWSQEDRSYSMLFAAFGGEESGLVGSRHFVANYENIDLVKLMLNIDMAGSEGWLIPFMDVSTHQSPKWLVEDSYAFDRSLGYNDLEYPTHFFTLNGIGGGAGSDHMPFMEKEIAAISFTSGINLDPIHTPMDQMQFLSKPMLARSGRLVSSLIAKYQQQGIPNESTGQFMFWQGFLGNLFIPNWLLIGINVLAVILGILVFLQTRKHRMKIPRKERAKIPGLKLAFLLIVIAIVMQLGEWSMQGLKGWRYPWLTHFDKYMWFAAIWTLAGIWIALNISKKWRFSQDSYIYIKRAIILLVLFVVLLSFVKARVAVYPALTLIMAVLVVNIPISWARILFTILAPIPMFKLMFMETLPFMGRSIAQFSGFQSTFWGEWMTTGVLALIMTLWFLPIIFLIAYTIRSESLALSLAKLYRKPVTGLLILVLVAAYGGYLYTYPAFSDKWKPAVRIDAEYNANTQESAVKIRGNDYLRGVTVSADTLNRQYEGRILSDDLPLTVNANWVAVSGSDSMLSAVNDSTNLIQANWMLTTAEPWYSTTLTLSLDTLAIDSIVTDLEIQKGKANTKIIWSAEPADTIHVDAKLFIPKGAKLIRKVSSVYYGIPLPMTVESPHATILKRTTVSYQDTLGWGN